jgi:hypothetical protein
LTGSFPGNFKEGNEIPGERRLRSSGYYLNESSRIKNKNGKGVISSDRLPPTSIQRHRAPRACSPEHKDLKLLDLAQLLGNPHAHKDEKKNT